MIKNGVLILKKILDYKLPVTMNLTSLAFERGLEFAYNRDLMAVISLKKITVTDIYPYSNHYAHRYFKDEFSYFKIDCFDYSDNNSIL